jgi:hypothetical protein
MSAPFAYNRYMALPENLPLADRWRRALAELPIRDRAWFLDCEPSLNEGRLLLSFKTALHARSSAERIALLLPLTASWIPSAHEIEILLADKSLLVMPLPRLPRPTPPAPAAPRPPVAPPAERVATPLTRQAAQVEPAAPPANSWRPNLDPQVKLILSKFGGNIVAVSRSSDALDLPDEI